MKRTRRESRPHQQAVRIACSFCGRWLTVTREVADARLGLPSLHRGCRA